MDEVARRGVLKGALASTVLATTRARAQSAAVTVNFLAAERPTTFAPVIAAFEKANPDVHIAYQQVPFDDLNAQVQARIGSRDPGIDVYGADTPRIPAFASRGYLLDLDQDRAQVEAVDNATAVNAVSYAGKIWSFPMWTSTQLLFYNRKLLDAAGIPAPSPAIKDRMTWEALLPLAEKAKKAGSAWGLAFEQVDRYYQLQPLFESAGGGPGLTGPKMLTPDITNAAWIRTAEWYRSLYTDGLSPRGIAPEQMQDLFANGRVAFFIAGPWNLSLYAGVKDLSYGLAPMPYFAAGKPVTPTDSWAIGLSPYAAHAAPAMKFAQFLTIDPDGNYLTVTANSLPPTNSKAYGRYIETIGKMGNGIGPAAREIIGYEIEHTAVGRPRSIGYVEFETVMNRAFSDIRNGADARRTLDQAQSELASSLSRIR